MFRASATFVLFDYFRVPYHRVVAPADGPGVERITATDGGPAALMWPDQALLEAKAARPDTYLLGTIPVPGRILDAPAMQALADSLPGSWKPAETLRDPRGAEVSAVWRADDGGSLLPFDPNEIVSNFWLEKYVDFGPRARATSLATLARHGYYRARPLLPRSVQIRLRRSFSRVQEKTSFPKWPVETGLDDLFTFLFALVCNVSDRPVPFIGAWPDEHTWALVLTHDVEEQVGYENVHRLLDVEVEEGYRSSWNFVPCNGYVVETDMLERLRGNGFEIGVHGLFHDGRDVSSRTFPRRLPAVRAYAEKWRAVGFRSPATIRSARLIPLLGFDYDSSYSDTAPFEPQSGGSCSWLPYMIGDTVELPITLVQDFTLFDLLEHRDETVWVEKAKLLRERGGMALVLTHPDYVGNQHLVDSYQRLLQTFADDPSAWKALPRDVSAWWRRRGASALEESDGEWRIVGPASDEARVCFAGGDRLKV
jgi:hypothetical protein